MRVCAKKKKKLYKHTQRDLGREVLFSSSFLSLFTYDTIIIDRSPYSAGGVRVYSGYVFLYWKETNEKRMKCAVSREERETRGTFFPLLLFVCKRRGG